MARNENGAAWRRFALVVRKEDAAAATALLETATASLAAIEVTNSLRLDLRAGSVRITAHVPHARAVKASARLRTMLASAKKQRALGVVRLEESDVRDEAWATSWKSHYHPFKAAPGLYIAPSWERNYQAPRGGKVLWMDPGMAFGTGQHQTTQLALRLLLSHIGSKITMLDIGCGSGILALAAAQHGADVYASDMDSIPVQATRANFATNHLRAVAIRRARGVPASFPDARLIAANITARVLEHLAPQLARKLETGGLLITSGVTDRGRDALLAAFRKSGLELIDERKRGEWLAHVHRKRARR